MHHFLITTFFLLFTTAALGTTFVNALFASTDPHLHKSNNGWPLCDPDVTQWSGYFEIPGKVTSKHYFYWAFGPRNKNPKAPVLLWMTGGPGCSSSLALLVENGPCLMNETTKKLYNNAYSWNNEAYVIYIDQPAGVGFSFANIVDYDINSNEVADDMYHFVQAFFAEHPELQQNDFFVVGESYGGHYAPATAYRINEGNLKKEGLPIRLAGLAIGNGLTDPYTQYGAYPSLAWDWCIAKFGKPCITEPSYALMKTMVPACQKIIEACDVSDSTSASAACVVGRLSCNPIVGLYAATGLNYYDIRKKCEGQLCYNFDAVDDFMNTKEVQESLGVKEQKWSSCNTNVNIMFAVDWFKNFNYTIPTLLSNNIRVMVYAGDMDFICNWIGNKKWTMNLEWFGKKEFNKATDMPFKLPDGTSAGLVRRYANNVSPMLFSFVQVYNAGHMVPMDQPVAASVMINKFMKNEVLG